MTLEADITKAILKELRQAIGVSCFWPRCGHQQPQKWRESDCPRKKLSLYLDFDLI